MHQMFIYTALTGAAMFIAGCFINYKIGRRRFDRRAITGVEVFRSYRHQLSSRLFERIAKIIGYALIIFGIMIFLGSIMAPSKFMR